MSNISSKPFSSLECALWWWCSIRPPLVPTAGASEMGYWIQEAQPQRSGSCPRFPCCASSPVAKGDDVGKRKKNERK